MKKLLSIFILSVVCSVGAYAQSASKAEVEKLRAEERAKYEASRIQPVKEQSVLEKLGLTGESLHRSEVVIEQFQKQEDNIKNDPSIDEAMRAERLATNTAERKKLLVGFMGEDKYQQYIAMTESAKK